MSKSVNLLQNFVSCCLSPGCNSNPIHVSSCGVHGCCSAHKNEFRICPCLNSNKSNYLNKLDTPLQSLVNNSSNNLFKLKYGTDDKPNKNLGTYGDYKKSIQYNEEEKGM